MEDTKLESLNFLCDVGAAYGVHRDESSGPADVEEGQGSQFAAIIPAFQTPCPIQFHKVFATNWAVDRGGLINLEDVKVKEASLKMSWRISRFISKEKVIERFPKWKPPKGARIKVEPLEWVVVKCGRCGKMWKESESPWD